MNYLVKQFLPPILKTLRWYSFKYGWKGRFKTFEDAQKKCKGYDEDHILKKIVSATQKVKQGEAIYERDGILYQESNVNFQVLNALLLVSAQNNNELTVIDFGGSLGTTYHQNLPFLTHLKKINWCIIEQEKFVEKGKQLFTNESVSFYHTIEECLKVNSKPNLLLLSGSLQYINKPYEMLKNLQSHNIPYLALDLIAFNEGDEDRICVQYVPPIFYDVEASYPCTFFSKQKLYNQLKQNYMNVFEFVDEKETFFLELKPFKYEGSLWKIK